MYGGSPADIAAAIWRKAPPGIDMNGDTTFTVADKEYDPPYPEYVITWQTLNKTNAIESLNSVIRAAIKKRKVFPTDDSVRKVIYLAIKDASKKWSMPIQNW